MGKVWYTSDLHFGHVNILNYTERRRYLDLGPDDDVNVMNEALVELWNDQVGNGDVVYILGDLCMGKVAETLVWVERLNGHKVLVPGNHDRMHPIMYKSAEKTAEWIGRYSDVGLDVLEPGPYTWNVGGINVKISHFPYEADHTDRDPRYMEYRPDDDGSPLVHGHVHDLYQTDGRQYNVGIDAWDGVFRTPEQIADYFRSIGY